MRFNLDPFSEHNDADLWESLERAHLKDNIRRNPLGLDAEVLNVTFPLSKKSLVFSSNSVFWSLVRYLKQERISVLDRDSC